MAVNIDTVYQRVLALANKEQRGYITPQEFNLLANQVQMDIFEQYFYDLNQFKRIPGNNTLYADPVDIIQAKIELFHDSRSIGPQSNNWFDLPDDCYRLAQVRYNNPTLGYGVEVEKLTHRELSVAQNSPLTAPTLSRPTYYVKETNGGIQLIVKPNTIDEIDVNYIKKPIEVEWNYVEIDNDPLYDQGSSTHFELHDSEEVNLVIRILALAGVVITDPGLYQLATTEDQKSTQQEKQ